MRNVQPFLKHNPDPGSDRLLCEAEGLNMREQIDSRRVWQIDPAFYYGDPEVDLAMSEMFGGFSGAFYHAYDQVKPRTAEYPIKRRIYNLYHYLNHYNPFGSGYLSGCEEGWTAIDEALYR